MNKLIIVAVSALMLSACEESDPKKLGCRVVSAVNEQGIIDGLKPQYKTKLKIGRAVAVRSDDFSRIYFVAAQVLPAVDGEESPIGVWVANRVQEPASLMLSMPGVAKDVTIYPDATNTKMKASHFSSGYREALRCLELMKEHSK